MRRPIMHITGARPNFPKAAPVIRALESAGTAQLLVHTGQHYDDSLSEIFFQELGLPRADVNLGVGAGSHATQTAAIMTALEPLITEVSPSLVVVYGYVNSTVAAALVAAKLQVPHRPCRGRAEELRHDHAGGDQPPAHRPALGSALRHQPGGHRPSRQRGSAGRPDPSGR